MTPPSICIVAPGELFGGVETQIIGLVDMLTERCGTLPTVVLFHDRELAVKLRTQGCDPVLLRSRCPYDPAPIRALERLCAEGRADVLHLHGYRATVTAALGRSLRTRPTVTTVHGLPEPGRRIVNRLKSRSYRLLEDWAMRRLRARVCYVTADIMARCGDAHRGLDRRVIHNGIVPQDRTGRTRPAELTEGCFHVGMVGRLTPVKGLDIALRAIAAEGVPPEVRLHLLGSGPLRDELEAEAVRLGIADRVRFHGFRSDVLDWLAHLDALMITSLHEGLPYTLLEAMSLGVPTIASRIGGLQEVLADDETGLLVDVGDVDGFAAALGRLAGDQSTARQLGMRAAGVQRKRYTLDRMVDDYLAVYEEAAGGILPTTPRNGPTNNPRTRDA